MYWLIGILIVVIAFVIIKLSLDTKKNPDSNLGILDHPSTYKKQKIEMVDRTISKLKDNENEDTELTTWKK
ncbi:MAG: hypothetical protein ACPG6B_00710 [Oceanihabitans sp.]